jgi:hypothetical protein
MQTTPSVTLERPLPPPNERQCESVKQVYENSVGNGGQCELSEARLPARHYSRQSACRRSFHRAVLSACMKVLKKQQRCSSSTLWEERKVLG